MQTPITKPLKFQCDAVCYQPCEALTQWDGRKDDDYLVWLLEQHTGEHKACNQQRAICASCLQQLKTAKVIQ